MPSHRIVTISGDGIGPEIMESARSVLAETERRLGGFQLDLEEHLGGAGCYDQTGSALTDDSLEACRTADAVLKAPTGLPWKRRPDGTEAGLLGGLLRNGLDLYANIRPIKTWPGTSPAIRAEPGQVDYLIVRENTEGLYLSRGAGVGNEDVMTDILVMTRKGVERVVRFAFELARKRSGSPADGRRRVTCVDKSNVLRSFWFFRRVFEEVGEEYPDVEKGLIYADAAAQALVQRPWDFDVLVMENFLGDLLSDLGAGTVGGLGMCPSGNYGDLTAYFEPVHGSAPDIAGQDVANPLSQVLSGAMMLQHLGEAAAAEAVRGAVWAALESGDLSIGPDGRASRGTQQATEAVIAHLPQK